VIVVSSRRVPELEASWRFKLSPELMAKIHELVEESVNRKLPEVVRKCLEEREKLAEKGVIKLRKIPPKEAIPLIKRYIDKHQGCRTSDIIYDLGLEPDLVLKVLKELEEEGKIRGKDFE